MKKIFTFLSILFLFNVSFSFSVDNVSARGFTFSSEIANNIPNTNLPDKSFIPEKDKLIVAYLLYKEYITIKNVNMHGIILNIKDTNKYFYDYFTFIPFSKNIKSSLQCITYFYNTIDSPKDMFLMFFSKIRLGYDYIDYLQYYANILKYTDININANVYYKIFKDIVNNINNKYYPSIYFDNNNNMFFKYVIPTTLKLFDNTTIQYNLILLLKPTAYEYYNNNNLAADNIVNCSLTLNNNVVTITTN